LCALIEGKRGEIVGRRGEKKYLWIESLSVKEFGCKSGDLKEQDFFGVSKGGLTSSNGGSSTGSDAGGRLLKERRGTAEGGARDGLKMGGKRSPSVGRGRSRRR